MNNYLLPTDENFVEDIAKAIARSRLLADADVVVDEMLGDGFDIESALEEVITPIFEQMWQDNSRNSQYQRKMYKEDARVAISAINLKLLTMVE